MHTIVEKDHTALRLSALLRVAFGSIVLSLSGCAIPGLRHPDPSPDIPGNYAVLNQDTAAQPDAASASTENAGCLKFEEFYGDPLLLDLIRQALANNRELRILDEEVAVARNDILARRGAYLPFVNIGAGASLEKPSLYTPQGAVEDQLEYLPGKRFPNPLANFLGGFSFLWQVDIWRELRNARDAAEQRYVAAIERRDFAGTRVIAEVAESYFSLMALDQQIENIDKTIELQKASLEIAKAKKEAGRGTELAVQRFLAEVRKNQGERLVVEQEIVQLENRINLLVNRFPQPVARASGGFLDLVIQRLSLGVPAQLLQNRRDIRQAERELAAAGLDIRVARARFFPRLDITANVGYQALNLKYLFVTPEALIYSVGGNLVAPLINKKAIQADYMTANARQLQAVYNYQRVIVNAVIEVVNRVAAVEQYSRSIERRKQQMEALSESVVVASNLFQNARVEYVEVLLAQRDLMDARRDLIQAKREQLAAVVNAYQALGGGSPSFAQVHPFAQKEPNPIAVPPAEELPMPRKQEKLP